jgi:predicted secreted hydrolase
MRPIIRLFHLFVCIVLIGIPMTGMSIEPEVPQFTSDGFRVPQPYAELSFPADHASHPQFRIEWWYLTGHLYSEKGQRFGYQATFFRTAIRPEADAPHAAFGLNQLYLAHMALTDPNAERFYFEDRFARQGWDAYASESELDVRNGPWSLTGENDPFRMRLEASVSSEVGWSLDLVPLKPLIRFGADGTSRKGPAQEARSYYLSFTRLQTSGTVRIGNSTHTVTGSSWMDHEIASNQLDASLTGWDWMAIQLEDGWEVKAYLLRQEDGSPSSFSACIWISPTGKTYTQGLDSFTWDKSAQWSSSQTGFSYPTRPILTTRHPETNQNVTLRFEPVMENQELVLPGSTYWEGAGTVLDESETVVGSGYLELVGYAGAIDGLR